MLTLPSSGAGEEKRREDYRHRHIDIDIRKKERRFYIPARLEPTFKLLEQILKREGSSVSAWIQINALEYVRLHEPGNPQQRMDTIIKLGKAYRAREKPKPHKKPTPQWLKLQFKEWEKEKEEGF